MEILTVGTGSSGNCYVLREDDGSLVLLDCGMSIKQIKMAIDYQVSKIKFALCTHEHKDHSLAVSDLIDNGIPVISNFEVKNKIDNRVIPLAEGVKTYPFGHVVIPFNVPHTSIRDGQTVPCKCFAYYIELPNREKLLYATDFEYLPFTFKRQKIETFLIESNHMGFDGIDPQRREHVLKGHSSLGTVKNIAKENYSIFMRNIILCHLSEDNANGDVMREEVQAVVGDSVTVSIAEPGKTISLDSAHIDWEV